MLASLVCGTLEERMLGGNTCGTHRSKSAPWLSAALVAGAGIFVMLACGPSPSPTTDDHRSTTPLDPPVPPAPVVVAPTDRAEATDAIDDALRDLAQRRDMGCGATNERLHREARTVILSAGPDTVPRVEHHMNELARQGGEHQQEVSYRLLRVLEDLGPAGQAAAVRAVRSEHPELSVQALDLVSARRELDDTAIAALLAGVDAGSSVSLIDAQIRGLDAVLAAHPTGPHAREALRQLRALAAIPGRTAVRASALAALRPDDPDDGAAFELLASASRDPDEWVRIRAAQGLGHFRSADAVRVLGELVEDRDNDNIGRSAVGSLCALAEAVPDARARLLRIRRAGRPAQRSHASMALARIDPSERQVSLQALHAVVRDRQIPAWIRAEAARGLATFASTRRERAGVDALFSGERDPLVSRGLRSPMRESDWARGCQPGP